MTSPREDMSEAELARFHEEHMDDESLWKKPGRSIRSRRGKGPSVTFTVRLTGEELTRISQAAFAAGTNPSDFIRSAALNATENPETRQQQKESLVREAREKVRELDAALSRL